MASMMPWSTAGWIPRSPCMTFRADLGDINPPHIWANKLSWELSGPTSRWISCSVRAGYFSHIVCTHSSLVGSGGTNDIPDSLLWLIEKPPSDMIDEWRGSGCLSLDVPSPFYCGGDAVGVRPLLGLVRVLDQLVSTRFLLCA